jgi:murein DD-endopeptidase MepM/ murein hydrolase activator NlpD
VASNRPAPQASRATSDTVEGFPAAYSNVHDRRFGTAPAGSRAAQVRRPPSDGQRAGMPGPRSSQSPGRTAAAPPTGQHMSVSDDTWHTAQDTGERQVSEPSSDATGEWRFPRANSGGWQPDRSAGPPIPGTGPCDTVQQHTAQSSAAPWDTGQGSAGEWPAETAAGGWRSGGSPHAVPDSGTAAGADAYAATVAETDRDDWGSGAHAPAPGGDDEEWNPTADPIRSIRGRHRVMKQRGGLARGSTVLGVGVIAAVGAGGIATAQGGKPPVRISVPDLTSVTSKLPEASAIPVVGHLLSDDSGQSGDTTPLISAGITADDAKHGTTDAGEALRERILQQADQQQVQAADAVTQSAEDAAVKQAADEAGHQKDEAKQKDDAAKKKAAEAAKRKAAAERLAQLAKSYTLPVSSYTLTARFGDAGGMWSSGYHTGLDFAAPTGTPLKAVHSGTVKEAGWSGAYGYRTVIELDDGTELWYCHQSSIGVSVGQKVTTGQIIGRVGATGNVTGPHLHLEVHPHGGDAVDPMPWLESTGLNP